jgi:protoheme ferro-lyase
MAPPNMESMYIYINIYTIQKTQEAVKNRGVCLVVVYRYIPQYKREVKKKYFREIRKSKKKLCLKQQTHSITKTATDKKYYYYNGFQ